MVIDLPTNLEEETTFQDKCLKIKDLLDSYLMELLPMKFIGIANTTNTEDL